MTKIKRPVYIDEFRVRELLDWDKTVEAVEAAMECVAIKNASQTTRVISYVPNTENFLHTMPGYIRHEKYGGFGCKLLTQFPNNDKTGLPYLSTILLFDDHTGELNAIIVGNDITSWRTAAATVVATKHLHGEKSGKKNEVLAILGAGNVGRIHALAFKHFFKFKEIRIWNRTPKRARNLVNELNSLHETNEEPFVFCPNGEECVKNADVVITATTASETIVQYEWLKSGAHVNAVGVNPNIREYDDATYIHSDVYIDNWNGAKSELQELTKLGVQFKGQIGDLITGYIQPSNSEKITVFQSLGMAVQDCAMARLIYDLDRMHADRMRF